MSTLFENLNKEQLEAVTHKDGPLLIIAGAGTGKTTVITRRIAYILEQELAKPEEILALTFTDKAAGEMEERVDQLLPLGSYDLWISTFHSFCERILKQHGLHIGLPNDFKLLDQTKQWVFLHNNFSKFELDYYKPLGNPNKFIDALIDHFSKCKDELITPEDYALHAKKLLEKKNLNDEEQMEVTRVNEIAKAYQTYQQLMLDHGYLDFADLIWYTIELLKRRPNIRKLYQQQFKFVMVDEFQDTNLAQYELIKLLTSNSTQTELKKTKKSTQDSKTSGNNLVVVGDDDQSIYKFRGASVSNILKLKTDYPRLKELTLIDNYRSSQPILDLAYNFIQANNPNRLEPKLGINKRLKGHNKAKSTITVIEGKDLNEELNLVVNKILDLKEANPNSSWNDFAILIRANNTASEVIPVLEAKQIPYSFVANRGLYRKPLIADIISYLKLLDNYHESTALYRLLNFPKFRLPPLELAHLTQFIKRKPISLYQAMHENEALAELSDQSKATIATVLKLLEDHTLQSQEKSAIELFVQMVADLGIDRMLMADTLDNAQNREVLEQFYKKIEVYTQENEDRTMRSFINFLKLEQEAGDEGAIKFDPNSGPESLKLLTIHSAKGLEFEFVFIVSMVDQRFPSRSHKDAIEVPEALVKDILPEGDFHLQEERRLFYVAITRAKTQLYLSWASDYGGSRQKKPSLFLTESGLVPTELAHKATGKVVFNKPKTKAKQEVYKQLPDKFSYSQISTFQKCPLEYKYAYYLRLPVPGSHYLSFGSTIHAVLERYLETYRQSVETSKLKIEGTATTFELPPQKLLTELYEAHWLDDWYKSQEQKQQYKARGETILKTFYKYSQENTPKPKLIEQPFSLKLGDQQQYLFNGKIDRADETDSGLMVIDYKTSEKVPSRTEAGDVNQLRIYQWACEEFFHEKVAGLQYWYLVPNETVAVKLTTPEELSKLKQTITETIEEIRDAVKFDRFADLHKKSKKHECTFLDLI
ncbi:MAG TPA: UvrD-helicase domain-containing protein [Candidatus Doudnabacteria bacterium]|nr:UvrD-helicase domain-containing protein [Candidatus Doudnabacteria bacterium]